MKEGTKSFLGVTSFLILLIAMGFAAGYYWNVATSPVVTDQSKIDNFNNVVMRTNFCRGQGFNESGLVHQLFYTENITNANSSYNIDSVYIRCSGIVYESRYYSYSDYRTWMNEVGR